MSRTPQALRFAQHDKFLKSLDKLPASEAESCHAECCRAGILYQTAFHRELSFMFEGLKGRTAVVFGVANKRSLAWAIAQGLHAAGANLAMTYQNERLEQEARDLILSLPGAEGFMCDVSKDEEIAQLFER